MTERRKKTSPEDTLGVLQRCDELLGKGLTVELACRNGDILSSTYYKWRQCYDGTSVDDAKELNGPRVENAKLSRLHAELEKPMLKNCAKGKFGARQRNARP